MPRKNVGNDHVTRPKVSAPTSIALRRRHAAISPSAVPMTIESTWDGRISHSVLLSDSPSIADTGRSRNA